MGWDYSDAVALVIVTKLQPHPPKHNHHQYEGLGSAANPCVLQMLWFHFLFVLGSFVTYR